MKKISLLALLGVVLTASATVRADEVKVAVAANFTDATRDIVPLFEQQTGHKVSVSFGSTGKLYAQIQHGAPFEVFLSADARHPRMLEENGGGLIGSRYTYAQGKLVLWSPRPDAVDDKGEVLKQADFNKLAIANPKTAPYGLAAEQVMKNMKVLGSLQARLVRGDGIAQTFQFVATRNADYGFVALSQVKALDKDKQGSFWEVPQALYAPIDQQAILLKKGEKNPAARAFLDFLKSEGAREVIQRYGYSTP